MKGNIVCVQYSSSEGQSFWNSNDHVIEIRLTSTSSVISIIPLNPIASPRRGTFALCNPIVRPAYSQRIINKHTNRDISYGSLSLSKFWYSCFWAWASHFWAMLAKFRAKRVEPEMPQIAHKVAVTEFKGDVAALRSKATRSGFVILITVRHVSPLVGMLMSLLTAVLNRIYSYHA